ncbi:MAG: ATP-binding protein [Candidatus Altiarchaeota archaeon]|nr:ATP-binding protein [Candidatus Altiarchaeota archaeon]
MNIGKVISTQDSPSPSFFAFAIARGGKVHKDQFVQVKTEEGTLFALVDNIIKTNRYYARPETVVDAENLEGLFPVAEWEFLVGNATPLGVMKEGLTRRPTLPPSPGAVVEKIDSAALGKFLGFRQRGGINLGEIVHHNLPVNLSLTKMFQKHVAILAMSGAGKSYLTSVLLEELLSRKKEQGRVASVIFDVHGEYVSFAEKCPTPHEDFSDRAIAIKKITIPAFSMSAREIAMFSPMSTVQMVELEELIKEFKGTRYNFKELAEYVKLSKMKHQTKGALSRWLMSLHFTGLFGNEEKLVAKLDGEKDREYKLRDLLTPGKVVIFDLSSHIASRSKQIIALWAAKAIFNMRRRELIPPVVMFVEEAHNFIPEGVSKEIAPAKGVFQTIAREGRKFLCALVIISQRPIRLDTTILSQCNTHIIMRITNPYDKDHIGRSSEGINTRTLNSLTNLQVGEALITGEVVRTPIFMKVRERKSWEKKSTDMELDAIAFETNMKKESERIDEIGDAFL